MPKKLTQEEFIFKAKEVHSNNYDYSLVKYESAYVKIKIVCPIHGIFEQIPTSHLRRSAIIGCEKCGIEARSYKT